MTTHFLRRIRQALCRHHEKRVWDITRTASGSFLARVYCPRCGRRWEMEQAPDEIVRAAAGDNEEMRDLMRRNLGLSKREDDRGPSGDE